MSKAVTTKTTDRILNISSWKTLLKMINLFGLQTIAAAVLIVLVWMAPEMASEHQKLPFAFLAGGFIIVSPLWWWLFVIDDYARRIESLEQKNAALEVNLTVKTRDR